MPDVEKSCVTCEHFSRPNAASTRCAHADHAYLASDPGVSQTRNAFDGGADCPLFALSGEIVVRIYRKDQGQCPWCAWPVGTCSHGVST